MSKFTVIGAGIAGASIAYHLAKAGYSVTVYDRSDQGQATRASAGIICPWVSQRRNQKWHRLVQEGARYYPHFIDELENATKRSTGYKRKGAICLFKDDHIQELAFQRISAKQEGSPEMGAVKKLTKEQVKAIHPHLTNEYPAVYVEGGGQINGESLLDALKQGILLYGGKWFDQDQAPTTLTGTVIYTAGAWSGEFFQTPMVYHQRAELLHFKLNHHLTSQHTPVVMGLGPMYLIETGPNTFAIGTTHEDTDSFDLAPSIENQRYLLEEAKRYFPEAIINDHYVAVGLRPFTRDSLPYMGFVKQNVFVVNGLGSTGLTAGPVIGREVTSYLLGEETTLNLNDYNY